MIEIPEEHEVIRQLAEIMGWTDFIPRRWLSGVHVMSASSEAQQRAMGIVLAVIDSARAMEPPEGMSARAALDQFADLAEVAAAGQFGALAWESTKRAIRAESEKGAS
jgi:hypothetical protein